LSGIVFGFFELATYHALKIGESSRVVPVTQISLIFTITFGYIFLKERDNLLQKISGITVIVAGIVLLYLV
jgi:transporter family protein